MDLLEKLYRTSRAELFRYLMVLTRDAHLAEELVSETFCTALTGMDRSRGEQSTKSWLYTVARNKWWDYLRRQRFISPVDLTELYITDTAPGPEQRAMDREAATRALALLEQEDARIRTVVKMRIEGYSYYEIGQKLDIRENSARVIDFRARRKLREQLVKEGYYECV